MKKIIGGFVLIELLWYGVLVAFIGLLSAQWVAGLYTQIITYNRAVTRMIKAHTTMQLIVRELQRCGAEVTLVPTGLVYTKDGQQVGLCFYDGKLVRITGSYVKQDVRWTKKHTTTLLASVRSFTACAVSAKGATSSENRVLSDSHNRAPVASHFSAKQILDDVAVESKRPCVLRLALVVDDGLAVRTIERLVLLPELTTHGLIAPHRDGADREMSNHLVGEGEGKGKGTIAGQQNGTLLRRVA